jgi:hypothetical protein
MSKTKVTVYPAPSLNHGYDPVKFKETQREISHTYHRKTQFYKKYGQDVLRQHEWSRKDF